MTILVVVLPEGGVKGVVRDVWLCFKDINDPSRNWLHICSLGRYPASKYEFECKLVSVFIGFFNETKGLLEIHKFYLVVYFNILMEVISASYYYLKATTSSPILSLPLISCL